MHNIIKKLFFGKNNESAKSAYELITEFAVKKAIAYSGISPKDVKVKNTEIADGCVEVDFEASSTTRCEMTYICYIDLQTGQVLGFMGEAQKSYLDYPEPYYAPQVQPDVNTSSPIHPTIAA